MAVNGPNRPESGPQKKEENGDWGAWRFSGRKNGCLVLLINAKWFCMEATKSRCLLESIVSNHGFTLDKGLLALIGHAQMAKHQQAATKGHGFAHSQIAIGQ